MSPHANDPPGVYYHLMRVSHRRRPKSTTKPNKWPPEEAAMRGRILISPCAVSRLSRQCCCCCFCFLSSSFLFPHSSLSSMSLGAHLSKINKWLHALFTALVLWHSSRCTRLIFPGWKAGRRKVGVERIERNHYPEWKPAAILKPPRIRLWSRAEWKVVGDRRGLLVLETGGAAQPRTVSLINYTQAPRICPYSDLLPEEKAKQIAIDVAGMLRFNRVWYFEIEIASASHRGLIFPLARAPVFCVPINWKTLLSRWLSYSV